MSESLPKFEAMATKVGYRWLWDTDRLTFFDIYVGSVWEFLFIFREAPALAESFKLINLKKNAPNMVRYVKRFRDHFAIKPYCSNLKAAHAHAERM